MTKNKELNKSWVHPVSYDIGITRKSLWGCYYKPFVKKKTRKFNLWVTDQMSYNPQKKNTIVYDKLFLDVPI